MRRLTIAQARELARVLAAIALPHLDHAEREDRHSELGNAIANVLFLAPELSPRDVVDELVDRRVREFRLRVRHPMTLEHELAAGVIAWFAAAGAA